jgi:hypothetical protein
MSEKLESAKDFFDKILEPERDKFFAEPSNFFSVYCLVSALFHIHEWIFHFNKTQITEKYACVSRSHELWQNVVEINVPDAKFMRDLANSMKHVEIDRRPSTNVNHIANT